MAASLGAFDVEDECDVITNGSGIADAAAAETLNGAALAGEIGA